MEKSEKDRIEDAVYRCLIENVKNAGFEHGEFELGRLYFTGWKYTHEIAGACGQIILRRPKPKPGENIDRDDVVGFYVNLPGLQGGPFKRGQCFDISGGYLEPMYTTPEAVEELLKAGLNKLLTIVIEHRPEWLIEACNIFTERRGLVGKK